MAATVIALRRGRKPTLDGRQVFGLYPKGSTDKRRWIYAVGFADGRTKIGVALRPYSRVCQHWTAAEGGVAWAHLFAHFPLKRAAAIERRAVLMLAHIASRVGMTESFRGLDRAATISCVRAAIALHA